MNRTIVVKNHEEGRGKLCSADVKGIESWTFDLTIEDDSLLTEAGKLEHKLLGQRTKQRLPTLLGGKYSSDEITEWYRYIKQSSDTSIWLTLTLV